MKIEKLTSPKEGLAESFAIYLDRAELLLLTDSLMLAAVQTPYSGESLRAAAIRKLAMLQVLINQK